MRPDKRAAGWLIRSGGLSRLEERERYRPNVLRVLAYHRIADPDGDDPCLDPTLRSASPEQFAQQMTFLASRYRVLSLEDVLCALARDADLPPRSVLVTFDDGYRDFADEAWPVLERLQLPAVLFVATGYLDGDGRRYWWDRLWSACVSTSPDERFDRFVELKRAVASLEHREAMALVDELVGELGEEPCGLDGALLTWAELRRLSSAGLYVGAHTRSHPILSRLSLEHARAEIAGSREDLQSQLGHAWPAFAYPSGHRRDIHPALLEVLRSEGFTLATTMIEGHNRLGRAHPLRLRRVGVAPHLSLDEFRLALTSAYDLYGALARARERIAFERTV